MSERTDLIRGLELAPSILRGFVESIPEEALDLRRGEGFWTLREHLAHLTDSQELLTARLTKFRDEDRPRFVPHLPGDDEGEKLPLDVPPLELVGRFRAERTRQLELIRGYSPAVWTRVGEHPEYRLYTTLIFVRHIYVHDLWHLYRMEELWLTRDEYLSELR